MSLHKQASVVPLFRLANVRIIYRTAILMYSALHPILTGGVLTNVIRLDFWRHTYASFYPRRKVLLEMLGWGVWPVSCNPYPV